MQSKDRAFNMLFITLALVAWLAVAQVVTTTYPRENPTTGLIGAAFIGIAFGLTTTPVFWLVPFARHRRIALRGSWVRAARRGAWVAVVVALLVVLRIQDVLSLPIGLFLVAMVVLAEVTLTVER